MSQHKPMFMSAEHIALMNRALQASPAVQAACARLQSDLAVAFMLSDGPGGGAVHWCVMCSRQSGIVMGLGPTTRAADVVVRSDYRAMVRASQGARTGEGGASPMVVDGDPVVVATVMRLLALARTAGVVDVEFPPV